MNVKHARSLLTLSLGAALCVVMLAGQPLPNPVQAQTQPAATDGDARVNRQNIFAARRLLRLGSELIEVPSEQERGLRMLENVIEQHSDTPVRYEAHLVLGRHYLNEGDTEKALQQFRYIREVENDEALMQTELRDVFVESIYLTGVAYYNLRQYGPAFPVLRKITSEYPNTIWANQAYYYIGMCHFMQKNWNRAIENLSLVGTFVDPNSPTAQYVEAGRRFYVKVVDADLPIERRLGLDATVKVETTSGDSATIQLQPLSQKEGIYIGSISTEVGPANPDDDVLQVIGGDTIKVTYIDRNTQTGEADVPRSAEVTVVSSGSVAFTLGTFQGQASAAFLNQDLYVVVYDADLDVTPEADTATVRVASRYRVYEDGEAVGAEGINGGMRQEEARYAVRDEVTVTLTELGEGPIVRSGRFGGRVRVIEHRGGQADTTDDLLEAMVGDEIVVTYVDDLHIAGESPRTVTDVISVAGNIETRPRARQPLVTDATLRARKNLVESEAYLELARIFNDMGLVDGAKERASEGLERVDQIIKEEDVIADTLRENAFKLKWELHIAREEYAEAIATCQLFHRLYPHSLFVDAAMIGIAEIKLRQKEFGDAINIYRQVLALENSQAKAEAQYMIALTMEKQAEELRRQQMQRTGATTPVSAGPTIPQAAIMEYRKVAQQYPSSEFAGKALGKLVEYFTNTRDYVQANDLLERIFEDYPDAEFLDEMLLRWMLVSFRMGDFQKAHDTAQRLLVEYPDSPRAQQAQQVLPQIRSRLPQAQQD